MAFTFQCIRGLETPAVEAVLSNKQGSSCKVTFQNFCAQIEHSCLHGAQDCSLLLECEFTYSMYIHKKY